MAPSNSRRTQANVTWLAVSTVFVAMVVYGAYGSDILRDANGQRPPWQALTSFTLVVLALARHYLLNSLDPDGKPPLRTRLAAAALPVAGCLAAALSILLAAKAVYMTMATESIDALNGWRIAEAIMFAMLALAAWRRWKRRSA